MQSKSKQWSTIAAIAAALLGAAGYGLYGGDELQYVNTSTGDQRFRMEMYSAKRYQRLLHRHLIDPGYFVLYDNLRNHRLRQSGVVELTDVGQVRWRLGLKGEVLVGSTIYWQFVPE